MEIRRKRAGGMLLLCICIIHAMLAHAQIKSQPPPPQKVYSIQDGNMHIELSKHLSMASLDTFINRYALTDLKINDFIKTNSFEHLQNLGWTLDYNDASRFAISKPLRSSNAIGDYAKKIVVTEKSETVGRFPVESENVMYGFNKFIHKNPFSVNGDDVTFFLRGFTKSNKVFLAGKAAPSTWPAASTTGTLRRWQ